MAAHGKKVAIYTPRGDPLPENYHAVSLTSDFYFPELWENKTFYCLSNSIWDILIGHSNLTNIITIFSIHFSVLRWFLNYWYRFLNYCSLSFLWCPPDLITSTCSK
jgi:hypothetical protein